MICSPVAGLRPVCASRTGLTRTVNWTRPPMQSSELTIGRDPGVLPLRRHSASWPRTTSTSMRRSLPRWAACRPTRSLPPPRRPLSAQRGRAARGYGAAQTVRQGQRATALSASARWLLRTRTIHAAYGWMAAPSKPEAAAHHVAAHMRMAESTPAGRPQRHSGPRQRSLPIRPRPGEAVASPG